MSEDIKKLLRKSSGVYSLPSVYAEFNKKLESPYTTNAQLADIIQLDAGLSAFLLKVVNSAFFGFSSTISSIAHAMSIIGRRELATLVLGKSVIDVFSKLNIKVELLNAHWMHSLRCALIAKELAKASGKSEESPETLFVSGLIHGIGKLVIWNEIPQMAAHYSEAESFQDYMKIEKEQLGYTYSEVGAYLVKAWRLPSVLLKTTCFHNSQAHASKDTNVLIVFLANELAYFQVDKKQKLLSDFKHVAYIALLGLTQDDLKEILANAETQFTEMRSTFLS